MNPETKQPTLPSAAPPDRPASDRPQGFPGRTFTCAQKPAGGFFGEPLLSDWGRRAVWVVVSLWLLAFVAVIAGLVE